MSHAEPYREHRPSDALSPFVECFWTARTPGVRRARVLPDGCADVIVDRRRPGTASVVGTMTVAREVVGRNRDFVAVRFHPGGARALLDLPVSELVDGAAPFADFESDVEPGALCTVESLSAFLEARLSRVSPSARGAVRLCREVIAAPEARVQTTADRLGLSRQHLRRRVLQATGIGPKTLMRVGRLRRAAAALDRGRAPDARLASELGYFDQAHLARDFRGLVGVSPSAYARDARA